MKKKFLYLYMMLMLVVSACSAPAVQTEAPTVVSVAEPTALPVDKPTAAPTEVVFDPVTIKINMSKLTSYAPIFLADQLGYFKKFGITLEPIQLNKNSDALTLAISGDLDVYSGPVNAALLNTLSIEPALKVVGDRGYSEYGGCAYTALLVRKDLFESGEITKPEDLKGRDVAVNSTSVTGWFFDNYMKTAGLSIDDVNPMDLPTNAYLDAFANKEATALVSPELHVTRLLKAGNVVLLSSSTDFPSQQQGVLVFGKTMMQDHPELGARFMAAYLMGAQKLAEGKTDENVNAIVAATSEDVELIKEACWISVSSDAMINFAATDILQQWYVERGLLDAPITEEQFWTPKFIEEGAKLLNN